ncbi:hypothetical protein ACN2WE_06620 [Streptomyces sp. cg28]|uniref:hypothetical protein n=1 Tax=unclassified Streptomyces TaxID=2593676 RepID=UPI000DC3B726|nr:MULTISPECIES: hypothetical protein [unclassified Streptomyces]RAJ87156.1 hypothetical protein K377_02839 [Streptomyces sp. PsTaAH-137]
MPPAAPQPARSAEEVNEQIRGLWLRAGGRLTAEQRAQYELLVTEWAQATRTEVVKAA